MLAAESAPAVGAARGARDRRVHVEIIITAKDNLPEGLDGKLQNGFESGVSAEEVFERTSIPGPYSAWESRVAHAQLSHRRAILFFKMDAGTLRTHLEQLVEGPDQNTSIGDLRRHVDAVVPRLEKLFDDEEAEIHTLEYEMVAEQKAIQVGVRQGWWDRFSRLVREDAFPKIYVPLAALVATLLFAFVREFFARGPAQGTAQTIAQSAPQAAFNVVVALVALLLYLLIRATFWKEDYHVRTVEQ